MMTTTETLPRMTAICPTSTTVTTMSTSRNRKQPRTSVNKRGMPSCKLPVSAFADPLQAYLDRRNHDVEHPHSRQSAMGRQTLQPKLPTSLRVLHRDPMTVTLTLSVAVQMHTTDMKHTLQKQRTSRQGLDHRVMPAPLLWLLAHRDSVLQFALLPPDRHQMYPFLLEVRADLPGS
jgi:hypothetical protein